MGYNEATRTTLVDMFFKDLRDTGVFHETNPLHVECVLWDSFKRN